MDRRLPLKKRLSKYLCITGLLIAFVFLPSFIFFWGASTNISLPNSDHPHRPSHQDVPKRRHHPRKVQKMKSILSKFENIEILKQSSAFKNKAVNETTQRRNPRERRHVVFLKVHKAGSTTLQNIMVRFALYRNLNIIFNQNGVLLNQNTRTFNLSHIVPLPRRGMKFDILCCHTIFDYDHISPHFPKDTVYIGAVREPFQQFLSAAKYYRLMWNAKAMVGAEKDNKLDPVREFLKNPLKYVPENAMETAFDNRMAVDFGINVEGDFQERKRKKDAIYSFLNYVDRYFKFVVVVEYFEESVVMLRRYLRWNVKDMLYIKQNNFNSDWVKTNVTWVFQDYYTDDVKRLYREWAPFDYALYHHFLRIFEAKLKRQSKDFFEEVDYFKRLLERIQLFCLWTVDREWSESLVYKVSPSKWSEAFTVSAEECFLMRLGEEQIIPLARNLQIRRLYNL